MSSVASVAKPSSSPRLRARDKILAAAEELARIAGPGNLSLDAVAARAGVSKGGLLYHFPTKAKLLQALVEQFLASFDETLREREALNGGAPDSLVHAYLDTLVGEHLCHQPPPSGLLAALGEDPDFLEPVRRFDRSLLDRMKANSSDPTLALIVFLALHGMKSQQLLNIASVNEAEFKAVVARLYDLIGGAKAEPARPAPAIPAVADPTARRAASRPLRGKRKEPGPADPGSLPVRS
ncbi:MAG: TetR/AcrR family transcriptional regulator [Rhizobiales bacterium]|nr:TetR/AcrR family transcriptional regulator [Hyphomicrobiales bacterium]